jgi:hypothetical protein
MTHTTLSLSRRHVLGDLYHSCDAVRGHIPVYLTGEGAPTLVGYADESLGSYADAFSFHLETNECKRLSTGNFIFSIDYEISKPGETDSRSRVKISSITLTGRKPAEKPVAAKTLLSVD